MSQDRWIGLDPLALHVGKKLARNFSQSLTRLQRKSKVKLLKTNAIMHTERMKE